MHLEVDWQVYHSHPTEGHAFLRGSLGPTDLTPEERALILDFTDRTPGYGDGRATWAPYPAGRRAGRFYAITNTRPDLEARRRGSVITQVVLLPLQIFSQSTDLTAALQAASQPFPEYGLLGLNLLDAEPADLGTGYAMSEAFMRAGGRPVAVIGEPFWNAALSGLWAVLWPEARQTLHFRAFETPHSLVGEPDLLLVPSPGQTWLPPAWAGGTLRELTPVEKAPAALEFRAAFSAQVDASVRDLRRVNVLAAAIRDAPKGIREAVYALTLLAKAPLFPGAAELLANGLTSRVSPELAGQDASVVALLSDVPDELAVGLAVPVADWVADAFVTRSEEARTFAERAIRRTWLTGAVQEALRQQPVTSEGAVVLWGWWADEALRALSLPALDTSWDHAICTSAPQNAAHFLSRSLATTQGWPRTLGLLLAQSAELGAVLELPSPLIMDALEGARSALPAETFVRWAANRSELQIVQAAARALSGAPAVLSDADLEAGQWLAVWAQALSNLHEVDPGRRRADVLNLVAAGKEVPPTLLMALARDGGGDLLLHPQRPLLLTRLPMDYLTQTADAYLRSQRDPGAAEAVLLSAVQDRLAQVTPSAAATRRLISVSGLTTRAQAVVEEQLTRSLQVEDAGLLASLLPGRVARLLRLAATAVRWHFRDFLDPLEVVRLAQETSHPVEQLIWWKALEELVIRSSLDAKSIWRELHWPTADFPSRGSQRDLWQSGLQELRYGPRSKLEALLNALARRRPDSEFGMMQVTLNMISPA